MNIIMTAILIILAVCVFVAGFYAGHGFALKDAPNDVHWLAYRISRLAQRDGLNDKDKVMLRKLGSYLMRACR